MITLIGIPSAFLLHGYVGFIFGSVKANPWWSHTADASRIPLLGHGFRDRVGVLLYVLIMASEAKAD